MDREKYNKSKEALRDEIDGLYLQLTDKIVEYGSMIRNSREGSRNELTGMLNKLKIDQHKLKQCLVEIDGVENPDWNSFREDAEKTTAEVKDNLETANPSSL